MVVGGIVAILALSAPFQVPLALAVGWMGWWLLKPVGRDIALPLEPRPLGAAGEGGEAIKTV